MNNNYLENNDILFKKEEFLYHILKWKPEWISNGKDVNENLLKNPLVSLVSTPSLLTYNSFDDYYRVHLTYLVHEFWYRFIKGYDPEKSGQQPTFSSIELLMIPNSTELIQVNSQNDTVISFRMQTLTENVEKYPHENLLVKFISPSNKQGENLGFIDSRNLEKVNGKMHYKFTYKLITKYTDDLPDKITIIPIVSRIGVYMNLVNALSLLPKLPLLKAILKPNIHDYQFSPIDDSDKRALVTESNLDSEQLEIVAKVVKTVSEKQNKICLISGPAASGKTTIIVNSILSLVSRNPTCCISVCAKSNSTLDSLVLQLLEKKSQFTEKGIKLNILRLGLEKNINEQVLPVSFVKLQRNFQKEDQFIKLFKNVNVIATTLSSFCTHPWYKPYFDNLDISACFIDDAAYASELESIIPLMNGVKTLILVGDSKQLLPKLYSKDVKNNIPDESLFVRAQKIFKDAEKNPILTLNTQYRMTNSIAMWPNKFFYQGALKNNVNLQSLGFYNYRLFDHSSLEGDGGFMNIGEAELVVKIVEILKTQIDINKVNKRIDLGIITTCFEQRELITEMIKRRVQYVDKEKINIEINIVEGFQNKEFDIIVMSCVRSSNLDYIDDPHRLCVCLTRARHTLIVCGNYDGYTKNEMWKNLIDDSQNRYSYFKVEFNEKSNTLKSYLITNE